MYGNLYIVATPIGNLNDITDRAKDTLKNVDFIAVEDTRVSKKLLKKINIEKKLIINNNFNEKKQFQKIYDLLIDGNDVALISDAGTPCISDPGYLLVNQCRKNKVNVIPVPGASSVISALSISGLPTDSFYFEASEEHNYLNRIPRYFTTPKFLSTFQQTNSHCLNNCSSL